MAYLTPKTIPPKQMGRMAAKKESIGSELLSQMGNSVNTQQDRMSTIMSAQPPPELTVDDMPSHLKQSMVSPTFLDSVKADVVKKTFTECKP